MVEIRILGIILGEQNIRSRVGFELNVYASLNVNVKRDTWVM